MTVNLSSLLRHTCGHTQTHISTISWPIKDRKAWRVDTCGTDTNTIHPRLRWKLCSEIKLKNPHLNHQMELYCFSIVALTKIYISNLLLVSDRVCVNDCIFVVDFNHTRVCSKRRWRLHASVFNVGKTASGTSLQRCTAPALIWALSLSQSDFLHFPELYGFKEQCVIVGRRTKKNYWDGFT